MKLQKAIASGFGSGFFPVAPGTSGSLLGAVLFYVFNYMLVNQIRIREVSVLGYNIILITALIFIGVWSIKTVHRIWEHDAGKIVIDEIVGIGITLWHVPLDWRYYLLGFVIFRFFDILKPLGIKKLDSLGSDWSVMMDDVLAGVYSLIVIQLIIIYGTPVI